MTAAHAQTLALAYHEGDVHKYSFHSTATENIDTGAMTIPVTIDMSAQETGDGAVGRLERGR